jgi:hypothetical protein
LVLIAKHNHGEKLKEGGISGSGMCKALGRREKLEALLRKTWLENRVLSVRIILK